MSKLRMGIVGTGQRVCHHGGCVFTENAESDACDDIVELVALCDTRTDRVAEAKGVYEKQFGYAVDTYDDYETMYAEAGLDGVYVCGPNNLHHDMTVAALERGIHVLCEKPMETSLAKCDAMIAKAEETGKLLCFAMQMNYRSRYHKVKEIVESGRIGKPANAWCTEYRPTFAGMKDWVWQKESSGGAIVEKNCHHYDILDLWIQSEPTTVYATGNILKHTAPHGTPSEIVDNAWIVNDYACGARAMVGICFLANEGQGHKREFGLIGTEGRVFFDLSDNETLHVIYGDGTTEDIVDDAHLRGGVFRDFAESILNNQTPLVTPERARRSMLIPLAAEMSIDEKRMVDVKELA
jgi:predicted dehydrogenase